MPLDCNERVCVAKILIVFRTEQLLFLSNKNPNLINFHVPRFNVSELVGHSARMGAWLRRGFQDDRMRTLVLCLSLVFCGCATSWPVWYEAKASSGKATLTAEEHCSFIDCRVAVGIERPGGGRELIALIDGCDPRFAHAAWSDMTVAAFIDAGPDGSGCRLRLAYDTRAGRPVDFTSAES